MTKREVTPSIAAGVFLDSLKPYVQEKWPELAREFAPSLEIDTDTLVNHGNWETVYTAVVARHHSELDQHLDLNTAEVVRRKIEELLNSRDPGKASLMNEFIYARHKAKRNGDQGLVGIAERLNEKLIGGRYNLFRVGAMVAILEHFGMFWWGYFLEKHEIQAE